MPHTGAMLTTAWGNAYGPDAESWIKFADVTTANIDIDYASSRGAVAKRRQVVADRTSGRTIVLGFGNKMPLVIPNTTSLGTSGAVLDELRTSGHANSALIYNDALHSMQGQLSLAEPRVMMKVMVNENEVNVPTVHAQGQFKNGQKSAQGDFYFLDNRNNPVLIQYNIQFSGEKEPRRERIVQVTVGASQRAAMEQALATVKAYDLYGIHFNFGKATIQRDTAPLLKDMVVTLKNNPSWTLRIVGHTDSIGDPKVNLKLSQQRAASIKAELVKFGIAEARLDTDGQGEKFPKSANDTLEGRAVNRRVELVRTDR
ncbi:OmpA family protein [Mesorhizobium sp. BH1-1-5]|uniref:OmpA family protein n=1 Tax=Mesorhizobium sp. BH1-1-5 TaxID=2876661 RepID=UPI001CCA27C4|nr:OmpA family protein [Mesorhizobium sp. BH1-1-5]